VRGRAEIASGIGLESATVNGMASFDPDELSRADVSLLMNSIVAPRPIAWVSSIGRDGVANLAPFSFFNAFSTSPPTVAIGPGSRAGVNKDSLANVRASGEFVISAVTEDLARRANASSAEFAREVDEWDVVGVTPVASVDVAPPRVAESPAVSNVALSRSSIWARARCRRTRS